MELQIRLITETQKGRREKREKEQPNEPIPALCQAFTAPRLIPQDQPLIKNHPFKYHLIDFEPTTIDGKIVTQILENFKFTDGTNFFDHVAGFKRAPKFDDTNNFHHVAGAKHAATPRDGTIQNQTPKKLFCLNPISEGNLYEFFKFFGAEGRHGMHEFAMIPRPQLLRLTRQRFIMHSNEHPSKSDHENNILRYKIFVLKNFEQSVTESWETVLEKHQYKVDWTESQTLANVLAVLPLYLFYVDLLSAIMPVRPLDTEGKLLKEQRQTAGEIFIQLLKQALLNDNSGDLKNDGTDEISAAINEFTHVVRNRKLSNDTIMAGLICQALKVWILTSRQDISPSNMVTGSPFKEFFNKLAFSWIAK